MESMAYWCDEKVARVGAPHRTAIFLELGHDRHRVGHLHCPCTGLPRDFLDLVRLVAHLVGDSLPDAHRSPAVRAALDLPNRRRPSQANLTSKST